MYNGVGRKPWEPDLSHAEWVAEVRVKLGLSQAEFAELVGTVRDSEAKWEGKAKRGPGFEFTRRIVAVAPPAQMVKFIGPVAMANLCLALKENPTLATEPVPEWREQAAVLLSRLAVLNEGARWKALARFEDAIEKRPPSQQPEIEPAKQAHGNETIRSGGVEAEARNRKNIDSVRKTGVPAPTSVKAKLRKRHT